MQAVKPLPLPQDHALGIFSLYVQGMLICFILDAALLVIFITRIMQNMRSSAAALSDLRQRAAEEEHIVRMGLLASGAAHELGTPLATLAVILGDWRRMPPFTEQPELQQEDHRHRLQHRAQHHERLDYLGREIGGLDGDEHEPPDDPRLDKCVRRKPDQRRREGKPRRSTALKPRGEPEREQNDPVRKHEDSLVLLEEGRQLRDVPLRSCPGTAMRGESAGACPAKSGTRPSKIDATSLSACEFRQVRSQLVQRFLLRGVHDLGLLNQCAALHRVETVGHIRISNDLRQRTPLLELAHAVLGQALVLGRRVDQQP